MPIFNPLENLDLHVRDKSGEERISAEDAKRQHTTTCEALRRLAVQPGLILADEVGMGKTFVALAVAATAHFNDPARRPVIIMVPPALADKWPSDAAVFKNYCLTEPFKSQFHFPSDPITSGIAFLKTLDDEDIDRRNSVAFVTHGALHRSISDGWVRLAILRRAMHGRHGVDEIRYALSRFAGDLLMMKGQVDEEAWDGLLARDPGDWLRYLQRNFKDSVPKDGDDPVPDHLWKALDAKELRPTLDDIYATLTWIPRRESKKFHDKVVDVRRDLRAQINDAWNLLKGRLSLRLPMLVFDEAHHLKNPRTHLVRSLFQGAGEDAQEVNGAFYGVFEKILFLTATPFQLGHHELLNVLGHFESVAWEKQAATAMDRESFKTKLENLKLSLDEAQAQALRLDKYWSALKKDDLRVGDRKFENEESWWTEAKTQPEGLSDTAKSAVEQARATQQRMRVAEEALRPWVLRHLKPRTFLHREKSVTRRRRLPGQSIRNEEVTDRGLPVVGETALPFLLAARTVAIQPQGRAVFAEGLASSYEAFLYTHEHRIPGEDEDNEALELKDDPRVLWYANAIKDSLKKDDSAGVLSGHPKVDATVNRVIALWEKGEKVVVFCHYIETGRSLRNAISARMRHAINTLAASKMGHDRQDEAAERLESLGEDFFDKDNAVRRAFEDGARTILGKHGTGLNDAESVDVLDIMRRYVRTPAFLARFFPLQDDPTPADVSAAFEAKDQSGLTLRQIFDSFTIFISKRCLTEEREKYLAALKTLQTGSHRPGKIPMLDGEERGKDADLLLPNVKLVNGGTLIETRRMLMRAFNSPFYPEVLISSAVLAEGVDLHLNCRHIIHHDLSWNPSTLEQRTGRVDRIGAKVERCGIPIDVYLPYVAGTQDEKMYRVVMDRERWFKVVMGEELKTDVATTDRWADRVPLPEGLAKELAFDLGVKSDGK